MSELSTAIEDLVDCGLAAFGTFAASLPSQWIEEALAATGTASIRRRKLPASSAVRLVIGMGLFADRSILAVVDQLDLLLPEAESLAPSAVPQARRRLGAEPLAHLFGQTAGAWALDCPEEQRFRGLQLFALDGVCMRVADTDANFAHFGKPGGRGGSNDAGYPQLRGACLLNVGSRMLLDAHFGPYATSEHELAADLWASVPDRSLTIVDRGFVAYHNAAELLRHGTHRHLLMRLRADNNFETEKVLDDGSELVRWSCPQHLLSECEELGLATSIVGRVISYQHEDGEPSRLFTTLTDIVEYPAQELVDLYHQRWEIELAYDEVKTHMLERKEALRSKSPEGVEQEVWGLLVAYNLVRREMALAAADAKVQPARISFRLSLLELRNLCLLAAMTTSPATLPRHVKDLPRKLTSLVLPERRSHRRYPRHVKIKMSKFKRNRGKRGAQS